MKPVRNRLLLALMLCSVLLLLILQGLWLTNTYTEEKQVLRKETSRLFHEAIMTLQDSLILSSMERVDGDTLWRKKWTTRNLTDSTSISLAIRPRGEFRDVPLRDSIEQVQVYISTNSRDSLSRALRPILSEVKKTRQPGNFVFRITSDSIKLIDLERKYKSLLTAQTIDLLPQVTFAEFPLPQEEFTTLVGEPLYLPHIPPYMVQFQNVHLTILRQISPQIAFALVVTVLIGSAFMLLYRSIQSQQRLMHLKNDLISNITHELKTPVSTVGVALEALSNFKALENPQLTREYLEIAKNELNRLSLITDKILKTSVFEEKGLSLEMQPVNLEDLIQGVLSSFKLVFEKHKADVQFIKTGTNFSISGNADHLTNVVYNLLDNAVKYSNPGSSIFIHLERNDQVIQLRIDDSGIGIPEEYRERVFDKFFRVPTGNVHNAKGHGLGLSYVASVIRHHGGSIRVESDQGKGSSFIITFPVISSAV